ncbi:MAG: hypothetical protein GY953_41355, partial [bacterium]|nr:hypothetical protein [bacterium]
PGKVVTREELREKLWPDHTFVDFDQGLNTAINKIREALSDSAANPRFVETVPRRGYRFVCPVDSGAQATTPVPQTGRTRWWQRGQLLVPAFLVVLVAGIVLGVWLSRPATTPEAPLRRFSFTPEERVVHAEISPNGKHIAYVAGQTLWIHDLDQGQARQIEGTEGAWRVFWSPDSAHSGFATGTELKKVSVSGDTVVTLCKVPFVPAMGVQGTWSPDGSLIVFSRWLPHLYKVPAQGGSPEILIEPTESERVKSFASPRFLPSSAGRRMILFFLGSQSDGEIVLLDLDTGQRQVVAHGAVPTYSPTGHVLYQPAPKDTGVLWALPFSLEKLRPSGEPFPVARNAGSPSVSSDGTLVYLGGPTSQQQLVWVDRRGLRLGAI